MTHWGRTGDAESDEAVGLVQEHKNSREAFFCNLQLTAIFKRESPMTGPITTSNENEEQYFRGRGDYITKRDDDDWYHHRFIGTMMDTIRSAGSDRVVAACGRHLVFIAGETILRYTGTGNTGGGTLTIAQSLWQKTPFRALDLGEDYWFRIDDGARVVRLDRPELHVAVRHGGNTRVKSRDGFRVVDQELRALPQASQDPEHLFTPEDLEFYVSLPAVCEGDGRKSIALQGGGWSGT